MCQAPSPARGRLRPRHSESENLGRLPAAAARHRHSPRARKFDSHHRKKKTSDRVTSTRIQPHSAPRKTKRNNTLAQTRPTRARAYRMTCTYILLYMYVCMQRGYRGPSRGAGVRACYTITPSLHHHLLLHHHQRQQQQQYQYDRGIQRSSFPSSPHPKSQSSHSHQTET